MADLTCGEIGKVFQANCVQVDQTQNPPVISPMDLTNASSVLLLYVITDSQGKFKTSIVSKTMTVTNPTGGIAQYTFLAGDLTAPAEMGKYGVFRYSIQVNFSGGAVLYGVIDGQLTIKNDSEL